MNLRGHHLLCIQRFRGRGYSPAFTANMAEIIAHLGSHPDMSVRLTTSTDDICLSCPHLRDGACRDGSEDAELKRAAQDRQTLEVLGLAPEAELPWAEVLRRVGVAEVEGDPRSKVCGDCQWLRDGTCS
jgi:hypothetical protein